MGSIFFYILVLAFAILNVWILTKAFSVTIFLSLAVMTFCWWVLLPCCLIVFNYLWWFGTIRFFNYAENAIYLNKRSNFNKLFVLMFFPVLLSIFLCFLIQGLFALYIEQFSSTPFNEMAQINSVNCAYRKGGWTLSVDITDSSLTHHHLTADGSYCQSGYDLESLSGQYIKLSGRVSPLGKVVDDNNLIELLNASRQVGK